MLFRGGGGSMGGIGVSTSHRDFVCSPLTFTSRLPPPRIGQSTGGLGVAVPRAGLPAGVGSVGWDAPQRSARARCMLPCDVVGHGAGIRQCGLCRAPETRRRAEQAWEELAGGHGAAPGVDGSGDRVHVQPHAPRPWACVLPSALAPVWEAPFSGQMSAALRAPAAEEASADAACVASPTGTVCQ